MVKVGDKVQVVEDYGVEGSPIVEATVLSISHLGPLYEEREGYAFCQVKFGDGSISYRNIKES